MTKYNQHQLSDLTPIILLRPDWKIVSGVRVKEFPSIEESLEEKDENGMPINLFFGTFKTYGGTEIKINGIHSIIDTAVIETWYRPDIKSDCKVALETGEVYEIMNDPEDINKRHQLLKFKVKRAKGNI